MITKFQNNFKKSYLFLIVLFTLILNIIYFPSITESKSKVTINRGKSDKLYEDLNTADTGRDVYKLWGGRGEESGLSVWGNETNIFTAGVTSSYTNGDYDICLLNWHSEGFLLWNVTWGGKERDIARSVWVKDQYIYVAGYTQSFGDGDFDHCIIKFDSKGNKIWNHTWGGSKDDGVYSLCGDSIYLYIAGFTGFTEAIENSDQDLYLAKLDQNNGNIVWETIWGGQKRELAWDICVEEEFIYTTGYTESFGDRFLDFSINKWDKNGSLVYNYTWGGNDYDVARSIYHDGTFLYTAGYTNSFNAKNYDLALVKWRAEDGLRIWDELWGGEKNERADSVWGDENNIYTVGFTESYGAGAADFCLLKWDSSDGTVSWYRTWGGEKIDLANSIWGNDDYLYTTGYTRSYNINADTDLFLVKWNKQGEQVWNRPSISGYYFHPFLVVSIISTGIFLLRLRKSRHV
jgi:hypothetical protein